MEIESQVIANMVKIMSKLVICLRSASDINVSYRMINQPFRNIINLMVLFYSFPSAKLIRLEDLSYLLMCETNEKLCIQLYSLLIKSLLIIKAVKINKLFCR